MTLIDRLKAGLQKSREGFGKQMDQIFRRGGGVGEDFFEELEESLIMGDVGMHAAGKIISGIKEEVREQRIREVSGVKDLLMQKLSVLLNGSEASRELEAGEPPLVILVMGVNGSGKTTTVGKLAQLWRERGKKVLLVAGDTFRAAAGEQLEIWARRSGADIIKQQPGADPSAVFFDALNSARSRKIDVVIGDTAGRLHSKVNLMEELKKIHRVIGRVIPSAPHQTLLVVDATTGQNGLAQAEKFNEAVPVSGIVLTKMDGTAKGGIALAIRDKLNLPICYVAFGEGGADLEPFVPEAFVEALLN